MSLASRGSAFTFYRAVVETGLPSATKSKKGREKKEVVDRIAPEPFSIIYFVWKWNGKSLEMKMRGVSRVRGGSLENLGCGGGCGDHHQS